MVSGLSPETACRACIQARVVRALPWPDVGNPQRPFAREHFALRVRKSDFLVAGERASFSDDLSTPGRPQPGQARRSASGLTPKGTTFLKVSGKMYFPTPLACLMGRGVFFHFRWATDWLQSRCRSCPLDTHVVCPAEARA